MKDDISASTLSAFSHFLSEQMGLYFPPERSCDLRRGLSRATEDFGIDDRRACVRWLMSGPLTRKQIEVLASNLTVGETYFFRDKRTFQILKENLLPELIRVRQASPRRLRIWSAGCCTGEEPYSIAILLDQILPDLEQWQVTILGTDVNPGFLQKAAQGVFTDWSFRDTPPELQRSYFKELGAKRFEILPRIRKMVTFEYLNLAQDLYPSLITSTNAMDLILCRNVLMYFTPETTRKVVHNLYCSLMERGSLVVSPAETSQQLFARFVSRHYDGTTVYTKRDTSSFRFAPGSEIETTITRETEKPIAPSRFAGPFFEHAPVANHEERILPEKSFAQPDSEKQSLSSPQEASAAAPPAVESAVTMARNCANLGNLAAAQSWAEQAIATDKLSAGAHYLRALILEEQGSHDEAVLSLKRALYLEPEFVLAHFALGNLAVRQSRFQEAIKHLKNARDLLARYREDEVLPESDGMPAGWLTKMIEVTLSSRRSE